MAQADYNVDNASGAVVRADINTQLQAVATNNSGATAPSVTYPRQWWPDETSGRLKQRNASNTAWIDCGALDVANFGHLDSSNNLSDLASSSIARTNLGVYSTAQVDSAISGAISGISGIDQGARDQIALTNVRLMLNTLVTSGALSQGYQWELSTDEWAANSSGYSFYTSNPNYYSNASASVTQSQLTYNGAIDWNGGYIAQSFQLSSTNQVVSVSLGASNTFSADVRIETDSSGAPSGTLADPSAVSTGVSFTPGVVNVTFSSALSLSSGTTYWLVVRNMTGSTTTSIRYNSAGGYANGSILRNGVADVPGDLYFSITQRSIQTSTLISPSISVSSPPSVMTSYFLFRDESGSAVLGTNLTAELSRDGGTTYTTASLSTIASYDGTYSLIKARSDVSAQPSGTSMKTRIGLNSKVLRIAVPAIYKE